MILKPADYLKVRTTSINYEGMVSKVKIAVFSDVHISDVIGYRDFGEVIDYLWECTPDYICIVGDVVDSVSLLSNVFVREIVTFFLKSCGEIAKTLVTLGNHDYLRDNPSGEIPSFWEEIDKLEDVYLLNNRIYRDDKILVMGYLQKRDFYESNVMYDDFAKRKELYMNLPSELFKIALIHSPDFINDKKVKSLLVDYNLFISGHYHSGCVPFFMNDLFDKNWGIINPKRKFFPKIARGIVKLEKNQRLLITGGITKIQGCASWWYRPLNNLCYKELDILDIEAENKDYFYSYCKIYLKKKK